MLFDKNFTKCVLKQFRNDVEENGPMVDVKIPLQCLVKDSQLILPDASKVKENKLIKLNKFDW